MAHKKSRGCGRVWIWEEKREGKGEMRERPGRGRDKEGESRREKKRRKRGRGFPLRCEKERGDTIILCRHYLSLSRMEERLEKGGAGEGKELSLMHARMGEGEKESRREGGRKFSPPHARMQARVRR